MYCEVKFVWTVLGLRIAYVSYKYTFSPKTIPQASMSDNYRQK